MTRSQVKSEIQVISMMENEKEFESLLEEMNFGVHGVGVRGKANPESLDQACYHIK